MNAQFLHQSASAWVEQAKSDIVSQIRGFLNESGISLPQMATDLGIDINELNNIMRGGAPSLETFATLLLANGSVLEIKPIKETPMARGMQGGFPMPGEMPMPQQRPQRPQHSMFDEFEREPAPEPTPVQQQPRGANGRFQPWPKNQHGAPVPPPPGMRPMSGVRPAPSMFGSRPGQPANRPPFSEMSREELVQIVREHLWQNEIDLANVNRDQLVRFLEDKDRQFNALREEQNAGQGQGIAIDPAVVQLKDKLKKALDKNPHLVGYLKDIFE